MKHLVISGLSVLALVGCATLGTPTRPVPGSVPASARPAVLTLMRDSTQSFAVGNYPQAAHALEQALRIEPRNPWLWHELAKVRIRQQRYHQAIQLAAKSNALSRDKHLQAANWLLIAEAHDGAGDPARASTARDRANHLSN